MFEIECEMSYILLLFAQVKNNCVLIKSLSALERELNKISIKGQM